VKQREANKRKRIKYRNGTMKRKEKKETCKKGQQMWGIVFLGVVREEKERTEMTARNASVVPTLVPESAIVWWGVLRESWFS
jgi:hypothetical protein